MGGKMPEMKTLTFESCETVTQAEFAEWVTGYGARADGHYELLNGRVVMEPPASWPHGRVETELVSRIHSFVRDRDLGTVLSSSQGYELPSGDTVQPDAAYVSNETRAESPPELEKFWRVVPDLVIEILSPSNASRDRGKKKAIYERNGVREYWLVDARACEVTRFVLRGERFDRGTVFPRDTVLDSEVLAGLEIPVADLVTEP